MAVVVVPALVVVVFIGVLVLAGEQAPAVLVLVAT